MNLEQLWNSTKGILDRQKALFEKALSQVASAVMDLHAKYEELEKRAMTPGPNGDPGRDGANATDEQVSIAVQKYIASNPPANGKDGENASDDQVFSAVEKYLKMNPVKNGEDGSDADPVNIQDVVRELLSSPELKTLAALTAAEAVGEYFKENPVKHGKDGEDGLGMTGFVINHAGELVVTTNKGSTINLGSVVGKDGADASESQIFNSVERYLKANPPPAGKDGRDGKDGEDGRGMTGFLINRDGELVATTNKGETINLGRIVGKDGENGANGKDGISYEGHMVIYDPVTHEGVIRTVSGLETRFPLPGIVPKEYWREGTRAKANEAWTHDGSLWIAKRDTYSKPQVNNSDWYCAVRKGAIVRERSVAPTSKPVSLMSSGD